ncbi:amino acid ABC transporter ATP-binding protein [Candidatus Lariskella endosymbiont of Hedychridium roseum]|uniref:amino acid ABC transporter ATP-binding protein n=1 Tax=Candidatus Lariskella endosymbiont of Hedychridium roseum TaxID=3077949 RepID=UPI0030D4D2B6
MLKIINVHKEYAGATVLSDVSLEIKQSIVLGLAGPSGSGKSTLLRCIQGLETITSGFIKLGGKIGFMFQDFQLFPHMSVLQNIIYAPSIHNKNADHKKDAMQLLENLGILDKANHSISMLSGGQKQRVALARSLIMNPDILLCDEPTSGLDVATISDVINLLMSVSSTGVAMVIASHDLDFLTKIADRIVLLKSGQIKADIEPKSMQAPIQYLKQYYV